MAETATTRLIGIAIPTLRELRGATLACLSTSASGEADAVDALREAGYAGGQALYEAFEQWVSESLSTTSSETSRPIPDLTLHEFGDLAGRYFRAAGWGGVELDEGYQEGVAKLSIENCWESDDASDDFAPACHVTTGMLAAFFGRLAGYPVAVLESECRSAGAERCSFLLGTSEVMTYQWEVLRG